MAPQGCPGSVIETADHAGHVAHGRSFEPALAHRSQRLAFKVDDDEILARPKHLAKVIVAVAADARRPDWPAGQLPEKREDPLLAAEHRAGKLAGLACHRPRAWRQGLHGQARCVPHRLEERSLIGRAIRFGGKGGVSAVIGQRRVHFRGTAAQQSRKLQRLGDERDDRFGRAFVRTGAPGVARDAKRCSLLGAQGIELLKVPMRVVEKGRPGVPLVGDEPDSDCERAPLRRGPGSQSCPPRVQYW